MPTIVGALLIAFAVLGAGRGISRSINRSATHMSEAVTTALDRLTTDVSTVITDVAQALRDAAKGTDDPRPRTPSTPRPSAWRTSTAR